MSANPHSQTGFTLVELIIVIVITGILSGMVAVFIKTPIEQYLDIARRAEMIDIADTALRRMSRDIHSAAPNSVRISSNYLEFLPTTLGGRYRRNQDCSVACSGDVLNFDSADTSFDVIGTLPTVPVAGQELVIYNMPSNSAYTGANVATVASGSTTGKIVFTAKQFPLESLYQRFQIISAPVTFACVGTTLWRYSGYARQAAQPTDLNNPPLSIASNIARLATDVDCAASGFVYDSGANQRNELVTISLTLTRSGDTISLYQQIHVNNAP